MSGTIKETPVSSKEFSFLRQRLLIKMAFTMDAVMIKELYRAKVFLSEHLLSLEFTCFGIVFT